MSNVKAPVKKLVAKASAMASTFSLEEKQNIMWAAFNAKTHIIDGAPLRAQYMPCTDTSSPPHNSLEDASLLKAKDDNGAPLVGSYAGKTLSDQDTHKGIWKAFVRIPLEAFNSKQTLWRCACKGESHPARPSVSIKGEYGDQPLGNVLPLAHPATRSAIGALHSPIAPAIFISGFPSGKLLPYRDDWIIDPSLEFVMLTKPVPRGCSLLLSFWAWTPPLGEGDKSGKRLTIPRPLSSYRSVEREADYLARKGTLSTLKPVSYSQEDLIRALCHTVRGQELRIQELSAQIKQLLERQ
jgi:hypothetical protein